MTFSSPVVGAAGDEPAARSGRTRSRSARSSVVRASRETSEMTTMPAMNASGDGDAVGLLDDVLDQRVGEDQGQHGEPDDRAGRWPCRRAEMVTANAAGDHHGQDPGGVGAGLGVDVGLERDRDDDR